MKRLSLLMLSVYFSLVSGAQDGDGAKDINVDINTGGGSNFWANPIVWVVGAAVFILLLVALLRGGRRD